MIYGRPGREANACATPAKQVGKQASAPTIASPKSAMTLKIVKAASRDFVIGSFLAPAATKPRGDHDIPGLDSRAPFIVANSPLPKQAGQTIRCLTFVAARRRVEGKALGSWRLTSK
jgi:hypothetical protein